MKPPSVPQASLEDRWRETWALLDRVAPLDKLGPLVDRYSEPHRAYHNLIHVLACLELASDVRTFLEQPGLAELAIWYHDSVYNPRRSDNEEASAQLAAQALRELPIAARAEVECSILATKHQAAPSDSDSQFIVDIDLAILGAPEPAFDTYEAAIRSEYRCVPGPLYRRGRREVLSAFLSRDRIYATDYFFQRLEAAARANISRSLVRLQ